MQAAVQVRITPRAIVNRLLKPQSFSSQWAAPPRLSILGGAAFYFKLAQLFWLERRTWHSTHLIRCVPRSCRDIAQCMSSHSQKRSLLKSITAVLRSTFQNWLDDNATHWAATLAFYTMLSAGPLLFIAVTVAGLVFGSDAASLAMTSQATHLMGHEAAQALEALMRQAGSSNTQGTGIVATGLGVGTLLFGASGVFSALQDALNAIWHVRPKPSGGLVLWLKRRFFSSTMVLSIGFLLMVSLVLNGAIAAIWGEFGTLGQLLMDIGEFASSWILGTALIAAIFKFLPDTTTTWRCVLAGALGTALMLNVGKEAIARYLGASGVTSPFGAAGSLALVLIWVYYAAQVLFFGAALTRVLGQRAGQGIRPDADAEAVKVVRAKPTPGVRP